MKLKKWLSLSLAGAFCLPLLSGIVGCGEKEEGAGGADVTKLTAFTVSDVVLEDEYGTNGLQKEIEYLLKLDPDRLLANFRLNAGIRPDVESYGGWENSLIGGHTMGHYLTAIAQAYANAGTSKEQKVQLKTRIDVLLDALATCQEKSKGEKGFLWGGKLVSSNVEFQFDNVEAGNTNITSQAWVPWYTMHKLIAGFIDVYNYTGIEKAKTIASALGDWVAERTSYWTKSVQNTVLSIEYGGMNDCMYNLYRITGKESHAVAAHMFDEEGLVNKILSGNANYLNNLHANTTIPKVIGLLNR
ncbi:MAG: beta-L-arabinofuranosidase domain-containing protein, partial [Christensenellaceae bacterium]